MTRKFKVIYPNGDIAKFYSPSANKLKQFFTNIGEINIEIIFIGEKDEENLPFVSPGHNVITGM